MNTKYLLYNSAYSHYSSARFQLKLTTLIFWIKFAQKGISCQKQKKWKSPWSSAYLNWPRYKISAWTDNFEFFDQIYTKRYFQSKTEQEVQGLQTYIICVANVSSTVVFKHFEGLKDLIILNILKENVMSYLLGSFYLKIV